MKDKINTKSDGGDQQVSPYPKDGFGQFMKRRQKKATTSAYHGVILIEEWNLNAITNTADGWEAIASTSPLANSSSTSAYLRSVSTSVYLLQSGGNIELQVIII
jgi:hypothetical protein